MLKNIVLLLILLVVNNLVNFAQSSSAEAESLKNEAAQNAQKQKQIDKGLDSQAVPKRNSVSAPVEFSPLYRQKNCEDCPKTIGNYKVSNETIKLLAPAQEYFVKYSNFLKQKNTGLIRLLTDKDCGANPLVIKTDDYCGSLYEIPGFGSSFSFRMKNYVVRRFADIVYQDKKLNVFGNLTLGIMFRVGDNQIENVSKNTPGADVIYNYQPPKDLKMLETENEILNRGISIKGIEYKKSIAIREGQTYLLRSIAFLYKTEWVENGWNVFDNSKFDERKDIIVAFQVVKIEENSVVLLWKELQKNKAPKIIVPKVDKKKIIDQEQKHTE